VVGVDSSRFRKVAEAQADDEVVAVGVGHVPRRKPPMMPLQRLLRLVSGSWQPVTSGGLRPGGSR
jgi:hypothetical protein